MDEDGRFCYTLKARWLTMMFIDFIFGMSGVVMCSLKLHSPHDSYSKSFLRIALILTFVLIIFGVVISIALYKENHRCALLFSMMSLITIGSTTIYSEASTSANSNFLILFSLFGEWKSKNTQLLNLPNWLVYTLQLSADIGSREK
ncbi:hypothetical protein WA026_005562 [Henosepilachna vigintioctopunctata]|uniref:Uncharacterized protein n=1 Tax=Henosepilachna vigintioctopunctata TaxID=420089 RepID=A0AAW1TT99_9CUCU